MNQITLMFITLLTITSYCTNGGINNQGTDPFIGTWELVQIHGGNGGGNAQWPETFNDGYSYTFNEDGSFTSNRFPECIEGTYLISEFYLTLNYGCSEFATGFDSTGVLKEKYRFEDLKMILTPTYLTCIEGCDYIFKKVSFDKKG